MGLYIYIGDNGRLQDLRLWLWKCMLMHFCHKMFVQRSEFNSG